VTDQDGQNHIDPFFAAWIRPRPVLVSPLFGRAPGRGPPQALSRKAVESATPPYSVDPTVPQNVRCRPRRPSFSFLVLILPAPHSFSFPERLPSLPPAFQVCGGVGFFFNLYFVGKVKRSFMHALVLWCVVLNSHCLSPDSKFSFELKVSYD